MKLGPYTLTRRGDALIMCAAITTGLLAGILVDHHEKGLLNVQTHLPHMRNIERPADRSRTGIRTVRPRTTVHTAARRTPPVPRHLTASRSEQRRAILGLNRTQFTCIDELFTRESHWNPKARNPHSTAAGIPQLLGLDTRLPATTQMRIGLKYVVHRYGTPCHALAFHTRHGWY